MVTLEKIKKPKLYTESDQILNDLKEDLANLKSRMNLIEEEQEQNRHLLDQLSIHQGLANELIDNQLEEISVNQENYRIIANVMQNLKSPVSGVVDNLAQIISTIDDKQAQDTLKDCMATASNVLSSFNEVEDFCLEAGSEKDFGQKMVNIRNFFRDTISSLQTETEFENNLKLLVDKNVPQRNPLCAEIINICLQNLIRELSNSSQTCNITVTVASKNNEEKYGVRISDLSIKLEVDQLTNLEWKDSWVESIRYNQSQLINSGFNLLKTRNFLRKAGGHLDIKKKNNRIQGFNFVMPLTY